MTRQTVSDAQQGLKQSASRRELAIPVLSAVGMAISAYLWYAHAQSGAPLCAPGGGCYELEVSPYALLVGLPVACWGLLTYSSILAMGFVKLWASPEAEMLLRLALFGLVLFGWLFSIYLQVLARFVLGAFCQWCFASALVMTALLVLVVIDLKDIVERPTAG